MFSLPPHPVLLHLHEPAWERLSAFYFLLIKDFSWESRRFWPRPSSALFSQDFVQANDLTVILSLLKTGPAVSGSSDGAVKRQLASL